MEPSPRTFRFVPQILLPGYGWRHQTLVGERSFRQTLTCSEFTDRGFTFLVDREQAKVILCFDATKISERHGQWKAAVQESVGLGQLNPQPYWGFQDLEHKAGVKLPNCFYAIADCRTIGGQKQFYYRRFEMLSGFSFDKFLRQMEAGCILVDFDARTGHNHGTKFRMRQGTLDDLYSQKVII